MPEHHRMVPARKSIIRKRVRFAILARETSPVRVSETAKLGKSYVNDLLNRQNDLGVAGLERVCEALDVSLFWLLGLGPIEPIKPYEQPGK